MFFINLLISLLNCELTNTHNQNSETVSFKTITDYQGHEESINYLNKRENSQLKPQPAAHSVKSMQIDPEMEVILVNNSDNIPQQTKMFETLPFVCRAHLSFPVSTIKSKEYRDSYLSKVNYYCSNQLGKEFEKCVEDMNWELLSLTKSIKNAELMFDDPASYLFSTKEFLPDYCALKYNEKLSYLNYIESNSELLSSEASASRLCTVYNNLC